MRRRGFGSVENEYCVFAMQIGRLPKPSCWSDLLPHVEVRAGMPARA